MNLGLPKHVLLEWWRKLLNRPSMSPFCIWRFSDYILCNVFFPEDAPDFLFEFAIRILLCWCKVFACSYGAFQPDPRQDFWDSDSSRYKLWNKHASIIRVYDCYYILLLLLLLYYCYYYIIVIFYLFIIYSFIYLFRYDGISAVMYLMRTQVILKWFTSHPFMLALL
jgi:hypothetical protein